MNKRDSQKRGNNVNPSSDFEQMSFQLEIPDIQLKHQVVVMPAIPAPKWGWEIPKTKSHETMIVFNFQGARFFGYLPTSSLEPGWNLDKSKKPLFGASLMMRALKRCRENGGFASYVPKN
jgi:hypothetical protein